LALWESDRGRLLLARDPLGKKPLFYAWRADGALVFGSTLQAVRIGLGTTPELDAESLVHYLAHLAIPQERVIFRGVRRVPPGGWVLFDRNRESSQGRYWEPALAPSWSGSQVDLLVEIEYRLREAVRRRLIADVPLGAFLSGGLDSGTIVAIM